MVDHDVVGVSLFDMFLDYQLRDFGQNTVCAYGVYACFTGSIRTIYFTVHAYALEAINRIKTEPLVNY